MLCYVNLFFECDEQEFSLRWVEGLKIGQWKGRASYTMTNVCFPFCLFNYLLDWTYKIVDFASPQSAIATLAQCLFIYNMIYTRV